jgi:hypothetical protein
MIEKRDLRMELYGTPMFKSRKMKRKQSKVRESHVLKAKGRK